MRRMRLAAAVAILMAIGGRLAAAPSSGLQLALDLAEGKDHSQAAVEFRRLAMEAGDASARSAYYWMAGYEYLKASRPFQAERMMGMAEEGAADQETEVYLLRGEVSRGMGQPREAAFYMESLLSGERQEAVRRLAARRLAVARLRLGEYDLARKALEQVEPGREDAVRAIESYEKGRDKSPVVGGLLGLIPGLGYAYSGEYASGARSLLLNALCIWGLVELIDRESWGGAAVVGFAELTFYSGSIYGGADAAVRYNRRRLDASTRVMEGGARFEPNVAVLPLLELKFEF